MQHLAVILVVLGCGCRFTVGAIPNDNDTADLAQTAAGDDLAVSGGDEADLAVQPPSGDLAPDPCANPPPLAPGAVAARCVVGSPPAIDGDLADWPPSAFTAITHATTGVTSSPGSAWQNDPARDDPNWSARWAVRWDFQNVYVALSITDDVRNTPNTVAVTQSDAAELFFDGLYDRSTTYGADDWQLVYTADSKFSSFRNGASVTFPKDAEQAFGGVSPNWTLEAKIPWSALGDAPATVGRIIGFDLKLDDNDSGATRQRDLILFYAAGSNSGSTCAAPYCRTDAFGAVQLHGR